jgi:D-alanine-D-alanine ligase
MSEANRKIRIAVLLGGQSGEHDVSLRSAQTIIDALDPERYEVVPVGITREGEWLTNDDPLAVLAADSSMPGLAAGIKPLSELTQIESSKSPPVSLAAGVDVVFPALHGPMGEDGTIQGMLELSGTAYVGAGVLGSAVSMDKAITKTILTQAGLPQLPWLQVLRNEVRRNPQGIADHIGGKIGFPCFVKPANLGSSVGISKVHDPSEMIPALELAAHYDRKIIIERGVVGREIELAVLGNDDPIVSIAGEVKPAGEFYDFNAKYVDDTAELIIPAKLDQQLLGYLQELAIAAFQALDLAGMARVDFFIERDTDHVYVNEVNTLPGFTSISMYPMLWAASGLPLPKLVDRLVELALERHADKRSTGAG